MLFGHNLIMALDTRILEQIDNSWQSRKLVNFQDYQTWRKSFIFEALRGCKYGQSFCQHFDVKDNLLFYVFDPHRAHNYIQEHYLVD